MQPKTIFLLGGYGYAGKCLTKRLLAETDVNVVLAGRNLEKAQAFAAELSSPRVSARKADAADWENLQSALAGADLCLVAAPTSALTQNVVRACIDSRTDYLDIQFSFKKLPPLFAAREEIEKANLCFVTEAGYHPGLPSALIRYAAAKLDEVESARTAAYLNMKNIPYNEAADELMEAFLDYQAQTYKNGAWTKPSSWDMREFEFGEGIGKRLCYSMFFEELRDIPKMFPSIKNTGFYISGSNWLADWVVTPLVFAGLKIAPKRGLRPLGRLMWRSMGLGKPPYLVALKAEAKGKRGGKDAEVCAQISHPDGYELTAIPVVAFLKQYLEGSARKAGVHMMGHLADPDRLFEDMQKMGAKVWVK